VTFGDLSQQRASPWEFQPSLVAPRMILRGKAPLLGAAIGRKARGDAALVDHARVDASFQIRAAGNLNDLAYWQTWPDTIVIGRRMRHHLANRLIADRTAICPGT